MIGQAESQPLHNWFYTNAPAAWIAATVAIAALITGQLRRRRPKRLVVREAHGLSLLSIRPGLRKRLTVAYDGHPINALSMAVFDIYNDGSDPIQKAALTVILPEGNVVLSAVIVPSDPSDCESKCQSSGNEVTVSLSYVNPFREHKQLFYLMMLFDGESRHAKVYGGGEGWSVRYSPLPGPRQRRKLYLVPPAISIITRIIAALYLHFLKVRPPELTWRMALIALPPLLFFAAGTWFSADVIERI